MDLNIPTTSQPINDAETRRAAMEYLGTVDSPESVHALIPGLSDTARGVRAAAFHSLEQLRCPEVYTALVQSLNQKNLALRNAASMLLINMQLRAVPALIPALKSPDHDVRKFIVDILGLIPNNGADSELVPLLSDSDDNVQISVIEALGNMRSQSSVAALLTKFEANEAMRVTVCEALGKIGGEVCENILIEKANEQTSSADCDDLLLATILDSLAQCGSERSVPLMQSLLGSTDAEIQHAAMYALINIHQNVMGSTDELRGHIVGLTAMLHSSNEAHAGAAAKTLAAFPESEALLTLLSVAGHSATLDQILVQAIGHRTKALEESITLFMTQADALQPAQWSVLLTVFREHLSLVQEAGAETVEQVFAIIAQLRGVCFNEQRALVDDILMMLDYDQAMMLEDTNEGGGRF